MPEPKQPAGRGQTLKQALEALKKEDLRVAPLTELDLEVTGLSTGNVAIDQLTGVGGLPRGRLTELYGLPQSGKTTTALQTAATAQANGETVLFLDFEHALDPIYCARLGLDVTKPTFLVSQPETLEEGMNAMRRLVETGEIGVVVVDSIASMVMERELAADTGDMSVSARDKARTMAQLMRQLTPVAQRTNTCIIFLNHIQDVIESSAFAARLMAQRGGRKTTPGGSALKFHASVRIEFKTVGTKREKVFNPATGEKEEMPVQSTVLVKVAKNKVGPPFRQTEVTLRFGEGFSNEHTVLGILTGYGIIPVSKGIYRLDEDTRPEVLEGDTIRGEQHFVNLMKANPDWNAHLTAMAMRVIEEHRVEETPVHADEDDEKTLGALLT